MNITEAAANQDAFDAVESGKPTAEQISRMAETVRGLAVYLKPFQAKAEAWRIGVAKLRESGLDVSALSDALDAIAADAKLRVP